MISAAERKFLRKLRRRVAWSRDPLRMALLIQALEDGASRWLYLATREIDRLDRGVSRNSSDLANHKLKAATALLRLIAAQWRLAEEWGDDTEGYAVAGGTWIDYEDIEALLKEIGETR